MQYKSNKTTEKINKANTGFLKVTKSINCYLGWLRKTEYKLPILAMKRKLLLCATLLTDVLRGNRRLLRTTLYQKFDKWKGYTP